MTLKEILQHEDIQCRKISLYKEGLFWKAYEQSAFVFFFGINSYKPLKKYVKVVNKEIVSIGFPCTSLEKFSSLFKTVLEEEKRIVIVPVNVTFTSAFEEWKASIHLTDQSLKDMAAQNEEEFNLEREILSFNLESKTPIECMIWLSEIKQRLKK